MCLIRDMNSPTLDCHFGYFIFPVVFIPDRIHTTEGYRNSTTVTESHIPLLSGCLFLLSGLSRLYDIFDQKNRQMGINAARCMYIKRSIHETVKFEFLNLRPKSQCRLRIKSIMPIQYQRKIITNKMKGRPFHSHSSHPSKI